MIFKDYDNTTTLLHVDMKELLFFFLVKKMVVGSEGVGERREEEIL